mmetsp:Transcript_88280/g.248586  ORF Transcript_88280/g.248586 Transcript_88280/m.248586 type:complete len:236 (+) Transcript_88280:724-1431(+)
MPVPTPAPLPPRSPANRRHLRHPRRPKMQLLRPGPHMRVAMIPTAATPRASTTRIAMHSWKCRPWWRLQDPTSLRSFAPQAPTSASRRLSPWAPLTTSRSLRTPPADRGFNGRCSRSSLCRLGARQRSVAEPVRQRCTSAAATFRGSSQASPAWGSKVHAETAGSARDTAPRLGHRSGVVGWRRVALMPNRATRLSKDLFATATWTLAEAFSPESTWLARWTVSPGPSNFLTHLS